MQGKVVEPIQLELQNQVQLCSEGGYNLAVWHEVNNDWLVEKVCGAMIKVQAVISI